MEDLEISFKYENNLILTFSTKPPFTVLLIECQSINENNTYKLNLSLKDLYKKNKFFLQYKSSKDIVNLFYNLLDNKKVKVEELNKEIIISINLGISGTIDFHLINNNFADNVKINNKDISDILMKSMNSLIIDNINLNLSNSAQDIANLVKGFEKNKSSNSILRLFFLKIISNYLINNNAFKYVFSEKIINLLYQINNNIHFIEDDSIKLESKKTYDIIHFSNYCDKLISELNINFDNFTYLLTSILNDEQKNAIDQTVKTFLSYDEYNTIFEPKIINDLENCFFDYSLVSCKYIDGENLEEYKKRKMNCKNMAIKILYHEDAKSKSNENIFFSDSIEYAIFHSKKQKGKILSKNESASFIALEVFYDEKKFISDDELNMDKKVESDGILSIKIKRNKKKEKSNFFGNTYIISQKYQVLPLYKFSIKRNEYYVLHVDPEFKKKKEYLKKLLSIQKEQDLLNMNIYFESSIEKALEFILKRRYNKVILICSIGKDKSGFRFVEIARKILFDFNALVLFFSEDENPIPEIGKFTNCLYANKLDLYREYILNYNFDGLIKLKKKLEDLYNITFKQFSSDFLDFTNAQNKGEFFSLNSFRSDYFREVYIKNGDNYIYIDNIGIIQFTKDINKTNLWYITLSENNEITLFSNGFYLDINTDDGNLKGNNKAMIKWKFEKLSGKFYRFISKKKENNNGNSILSIEGNEIKVNNGNSENNMFELIDEFEDDQKNINISSLSEYINSIENSRIFENISNSEEIQSFMK